MTKSSLPEPSPAGITTFRPQPGAEALRASLGGMQAALGGRCCIVGGFVRDLLLGRPAITDVDVVVEGAPAVRAAEWLRRRWRGPERVVEFERFGTARVSFPDQSGGRLTVEFVRARSEAYRPDSRKPEVRPGTVEEDALRRDFTVNALLLDAQGQVLDPTGSGLADLQRRLLRTPLDAAVTFAEDPLRMLRAARFAAQLEFELAPGVEAAMAEARARLGIVSQERVRDELLKLLLAPRPGPGLEILARTGLLEGFAPELAAMRRVEQGGYHSGDVFQHTCLALEHAPPDRLVRLAVLLHDVGKPATAVETEAGPTFHGHPRIGAELAARFLRRLRFPTAEADAVARLVLLHMRPIQYGADWTEAAVRRLWHDAGPLFPALLAVARADTLASNFPGTGGLDELESRVGRVAAAHPEGIGPVLGGSALMEAFGLAGGPWVGRAQRLLLEAVIEGLLPDTDDPGRGPAALDLLRARRDLWQPRPGEAGGRQG